jgi:asparaginyl-tRNA synthetase
MNEFWMIEPEIAFCDLEKLMDIEEEFIKYIIKYCLDNASDEIEFLDQYAEKGLKEKLETVLKSKFTRIDHKDVITILKKAPIKWEFEPQYGEDIAKEHERYITEYFHGPVFIKNWPKDIKAFYMKQNEDKETVAAVDLELPNIGEIIGGSQREESFEKLNKRMDELKMNKNELSWYLDLRKYGTCVHSGFGLGFERVIMYLTGMENIRDVIPFPRTPGNCDF